jgi:hypothetical protein
MTTPPPRLNIVQIRADAVEMLQRRFEDTGPKIAYGFTPDSRLNLQPGHGRTLPDLQFRNYYLGQWADRDIQEIDRALAGAMTDPGLDQVVQEYFTQPVSTKFLGSEWHRGAAPAPGTTFDRASVDQVVASLDLGGIEIRNTAICLYLPPGVILDTRAPGRAGEAPGGDDTGQGHAVAASSRQGLGGYHGSVELGGTQVLFAVAVYSQVIDHAPNGIPFWPDLWKNVVTTMYHELQEIRTDPDVEQAIRTGDDRLLGWYSPRGGEIGDLPLFEAGANLGLAMVEVPLVAGGTSPIQLMWSNQVGGPRRPSG